MTPEERAKKVVDEWVKRSLARPAKQGLSPSLGPSIAQAIWEAVAEERRACAHVAARRLVRELPALQGKPQEYIDGYLQAANDIAGEILGR